MHNKKVIVLTALFIFLLSSVCMAQTSSDRWTEFYVDESSGFYYDSQTMQYNSNKTECTVWIMVIMPKENKYDIFLANTKKDRSLFLKEYYSYHLYTGELLGCITQEKEYRITIPPLSKFEMLYNLLFPQNVK